MQLIILAALLATLAQTESGIPAAGDPAAALTIARTWQWILVVLTSLAAPVAAACDGGWFVCRLQRQLSATTTTPPDERQVWQQASDRYERFQFASLWLWLAGSLAVIYLWKWPALVRQDWGWQPWPLIDDLLILSPVVGSLVLVWVSHYLVERQAVRIRQSPQRIGSLLAYLGWNFRHYLALALLPALGVIAIQEIVASVSVTSGQAVAPLSPAAWLFALPLLLILPAALPLLLARIWPTEELPPGELHDALVKISQEQRTPLTRMLVWRTQGRMTNAAVAGLSRWCRYLFLTDALLVQLEPEEIAAVVRHELGHLQRRHLLQRLLVLSLPVLAGIAVQPLLGLDTAWLSTQSPYSLAVAGVFLLYAAVTVGQLSRWMEYDADLSAVLTTGGEIDPDRARNLIHALAILQGPRHESRLAHWLHPPTANRIAWIRRLLIRPAEGQIFRAQLDHIAWWLYAAAGSLTAAALLTVAIFA